MVNFKKLLKFHLKLKTNEELQRCNRLYKSVHEIIHEKYFELDKINKIISYEQYLHLMKNIKWFENLQIHILNLCMNQKDFIEYIKK